MKHFWFLLRCMVLIIVLFVDILIEQIVSGAIQVLV